MDAETRRFITEQIRTQLNIILSGQSGNNEAVDKEDVQSLLPGMPTIPQRPVMHPFGFASRPPAGTLQVTARQGDHPGNRIVLGHRDKMRPTDLEEGESCFYATTKDGSAIKKAIYLRDEKIQYGSRTSAEQMVLGTTFNNETMTQLFMRLIELVAVHIEARQTDATHNHIGIFGVPVNTPIQAAVMQQEKAMLEEIKGLIEEIKSRDIDSGRVISDVAFTEKGTP